MRRHHRQLGVPVHQTDHFAFGHVRLRLEIPNLRANRAGERNRVKTGRGAGRGLAGFDKLRRISSGLWPSGVTIPMPVMTMRVRMDSIVAHPARIQIFFSCRRFSSSKGSSTYLKANTISVEVTTVLPRHAVALTLPPASFTDLTSVR